MEYNNPNDSWLRQPYDDYDEDRLAEGCLHSFALMLLLAAILVIAMIFNGCTSTQYVPIVEHHTDTTVITKWKYDSIHVHDSIRVTEKGDTVRIEKWHTKYRDREIHDTLYNCTTDSVPYPVTKEVEKKVPADLTWWQATRIHIANILLFVLLIVAGGWLVKKKLFG